MKKIAVLSFIILFVSSCGSLTTFHSGYYDISLNKVENPQMRSDRYGETKIVKTGSSDSLRYGYSDDFIDISWVIGNTKFGFILKNKSEHSLKIIWDEAVFIDTDGSSNRVMHAGVKYSEKGNPQAPSVIAKGSFLEDMVLPTKNVYYETNPYTAGWKEKYYLPILNQDRNILLNNASQYLGKNIKIILPIQIEGNINDYEFTFNVENFTLVN